MAFQEFNHYNERRKAERAEKLRKRIAIAVGVTVVLAVAIVACILTLDNESKKDGNRGDKNDSGKKSDIDSKVDATTAAVSRVQIQIKSICSTTDHKKSCEKNLGKVAKSNSKAQPKDLFKAAISVIEAEVDKALEHITKTKGNEPKVKQAISDCKVLLADAKQEVEDSVKNVNGISMDKLKSHTPDLNNWLSAVMSYQQTCIDGFPDGKLKKTMQSHMKDASEMTSNALAIVSKVSSILSALKVTGGDKHHRRLLSKEPKIEHPSFDTDGFPSWMTHEDRRMLKKKEVKETPNVVVAKDGSGKFKTITEALNAMPKNHKGRYIIYVKEGVYDESVIVTKDMVNVTMFGDGSQKSVVTGSKNFADGVSTYMTATFAALGNGFIAKAMGFRNTAGPEKHQAVALRVQSDRSIFINCRMEGYQDTLYVQTHRQFYRSCVVTGTIDFVFGDASAVLQNCLLILRKPMDNQQNIITAQGRTDKNERTGIVIQNCKVQADDTLAPVKSKVKCYLGRPWKQYSRTIVMESEIGDFIQPEGWLPWQGDFALKTLYYAEYNNKGPGAKTNARVNWPGYKVITKKDAMQFTVENFLQGQDWVKADGIAVRMGLYA